MTSSRKLSALVMSVLIVGSVVAGPGGAALVGTVAAAGNTGAGNVAVNTGSVSPTEQVEGSTTVTQTEFVVENVSKDGNTDTIYVRFPDNVTLSSPSASATNVSDGSTVSISSSATVVDGPDGDGVSETAKFNVSPDGTGAVDVRITLDVTADLPTVPSNYEMPIEARIEDSTNGTAGFDPVASLLVRNRLSVGGTVSEPDSTAAANDAIAFERDPDFAENVTDGSGNYAVTILEGVEYGVVYEQDDTTTSTDTPYPKDNTPDIYAFGAETYTGNTSSADRTLPTGHRLNVTVVDGNGNSIEGATVRVSQYAGPGVIFTSNTTTANGEFFASSAGEGIEVNGEVLLEVYYTNGYTRYYEELDITGDRNLTVTLVEKRFVSGTVTLANGSAAAGNQIRTIADSDDIDLFGENTTDSDGRYTVAVAKNVSTEFTYRQTAASQDGTDYPDDGNVDLYALGTETYASNTSGVDRQLPSGYDVNVTVVDGSGTPLTDVEVFVSHERDGAYVDDDFRTNGNGMLEPANSDGPGLELRGSVNVFVDPSDAYTNNSAEINVSGPRDVTLTVYEVANVSGTVTASDDTPLGDSIVEADGVNINTSDTNLTDANGNYELALAKGKGYEIAFVQGQEFEGTGFQKDGVADIYVFGTDPAPTSDTSGEDLSVPNGSQVNVTIVNGTGDPVEDVEVFVGHVDNNGSEFVRSFTDPDGVLRNPNGTAGYELTGNVTVVAQKDGYTDNFTELTVDGTDESVMLVLRERVNVSGTVTEPDGTTPASDTSLQFKREDDTAENLTDANGAYSVELVADRRYDVFFAQSDFQNDGDVDFPKDGVVDIHVFENESYASDTTGADRQLPAGDTLNVTVVDEGGTTLSNATVEIAIRTENNSEGIEGTTRGDGLLVLPDSDGPGVEVNGTVGLFVQKDGYTDNFTEVTVNGSDASVQVVLQETATVSGTVTKADGKPAADIQGLFARSDNADTSNDVVLNVTDAEGRYTVELLTNTTYEVFARQTDGERDGDVDFPKDDTVDIWAAGNVSYPGDASGVDEQLPVGHTLNVSVVNGTGVAIQDAEVFVSQRGDNLSVAAEGTTRGDGMLVLSDSDGPGVEVNGTVQVSVDKPGYTSNRTELTLNKTTGDRALTLTLREKVTVNGTLTEADGSTAAANDTLVFESIDDFVRNVTAPDGRYDVELVRDDTYSIAYLQDDAIDNISEDTETDEVALPKDGTVDLYAVGDESYSSDVTVDRTLPVGHRLNITVVGSDGSKIENASVRVTQERGDSFVYVRANTTPKGKFLFPGSDGVGVEVNGTVEVFVEKPGYIDNFTRVTLNKTTDDRNITVALERAVQFTGSVDYADGSNATEGDLTVLKRESGFRVDALNNSTGEFLTEEQSTPGTFVFAYHQTRPVNTSVDEGLYPHDGNPDFQYLTTITDPPGGTVDIGTQTLSNGHVVNVTVVDPSGDPVQGARIIVWSKKNRTTAQTAVGWIELNATRADGIVQFDGKNTAGVELAGSYMLEVTGPIVSTAYASSYTQKNISVSSARNLTLTVNRTEVSPRSHDYGKVGVGTNETVTVTVTNNGDFNFTTNGTTIVGSDTGQFGVISGGGNFTLEPGETRNVTVEFAPSSNGSKSAALRFENPNATDDPRVQLSAEAPDGPALEVPLTGTGGTPANFSVSVDATNSPVVEGETLTVDATVTNDGDLSASQTINLTTGGSVRDSTTVTLDGGNSTTVTLSWTTGSGDAGSYTATVDSADDSASTGVDVQTPANFSVSVDATNSPVLEGETLTVDATISNTGDVSDSQTVDLTVGGSVRDSTTVTLDGGNSTTVTLSWATTDGDVGSYTATVGSDNDTASTGVTVDVSANYTVTVDATNSPVVEGDTLSVDATVTNEGTVSGSQTVALVVDGTQRDNATVNLSGGASTAVTFNWTTTSGDAGNYTATVTSENDSASTDVAVETPANFTATVDSTTSPVKEGQTLDVTATVTNTGDRSDTQTVELDVGGSVRASETVSLGAGESRTVTLSWTTTDGDAGTYSAGLVTANDTASTGVTVEQGTPANFSTAVTSTNSPVVEGDTLSVETTVENTGTLSGTQTVNLTVNGTVRDSATVALDGGNATTVTLSWTTTSGDAGSYTATVASDNDSAPTTVDVQAPANFTATVDATNSPVVEDDTLTVDATITNNGDVSGTQTIELVVGGSVRDSTTVTLDGGNATTITLSWATGGGDAGSYTAAVTTANDSASAGVTVEQPDTPTPTPTPTNNTSTPTPTNNTSTPTPTPTPTDVSDDEPTDTATDEPTDTPEVSTDTPTATATSTDTPTVADTPAATDAPADTPTVTDTPAPTSTGSPGFGFLVAVLALLAAGLLARRRN